MPQAHSGIGGHHFHSSASSNPAKPQTKPPPPNGIVHNACPRICQVTTSSTKGEVGGFFIDNKDQEAIAMNKRCQGSEEKG
jgi:hypothetical protein